MKAPVTSTGDKGLALPPKVDAMVRAALATGKWERVEAKPSEQHDGFWEVDALRNDGRLTYVRMWCLIDTSRQRGRFATGYRFSIGSVREYRSPSDFTVWLGIG